jgi:hypothetical protein
MYKLVTFAASEKAKANNTEMVGCLNTIHRLLATSDLSHPFNAAYPDALAFRSAIEAMLISADTLGDNRVLEYQTASKKLLGPAQAVTSTCPDPVSMSDVHLKQYCKSLAVHEKTLTNFLKESDQLLQATENDASALSLEFHDINSEYREPYLGLLRWCLISCVGFTIG